MYLDHFGFGEPPFSIAPDPRYLFLSERHREALAHLLYGVKGDGGFVLLTGEVGTGKTTVCRCLLEQIPDDVDIAYIFNPKLTREELLSTVCDELGIPYAVGTTSVKVFVDLINSYLLQAHAKGRRTVLIIDEAQNLHPSVLEQLRLLTNLETSQRKLLQIILVGQPELRERLAQHELRQLAQRVVARYHLEPLSRAELTSYVSHRLAVAGVRRTLFAPKVLDRLFRLTEGTPRLVNVICDRALLGAYVEGRDGVDPRILARAAREVLGDAPAPAAGNRPALRRLAAAGVVLALGLGAALAYQQKWLPESLLHGLPGIGVPKPAAAPAAGSPRTAVPVPAADAAVLAAAGAQEPVAPPAVPAAAMLIETPEPPEENLAAAARGAAATASSATGPGTPAAAAIDGDRKGLNWGSGGGWRDGSPNVFPDWLQVDFPGPVRIGRIEVYTLQDAYESPIEPSDATRFQHYGIGEFEVQYWQGDTWATVPGGSVRENDRVWRSFRFPEITTERVRVLVLRGARGHARIVELEAWGRPLAAEPLPGVPPRQAGRQGDATRERGEG
jgi:general secretion pathway protein A